MPRNLLAILAVTVMMASSAVADDSAQRYISNASVVGEGKLTYAFWDVYTATLYAPGGKWNPDQPFVLSLHYLRSLDGKAIADRSVQEIRKQGFTDEVKLADWNAQMKGIFPDVKKGDVLTAVFIPGKPTSFYNGNEQIGSIKGSEFAQNFSGIWLNTKTSEPALRKQLLGLP